MLQGQSRSSHSVQYIIVHYVISAASFQFGASISSIAIAIHKLFRWSRRLEVRFSRFDCILEGIPGIMRSAIRLQPQAMQVRRHYGVQPGAPLVLSPNEVTALRHASHNVKMLDASWFMPGSPRNAKEEFTAGPRIPGAGFFDVDAVATPHRVKARTEAADSSGHLSLPHMLPSPSAFACAIERLGIGPDTHVIAYDSHGVFSSPRLAWQFAAMGRQCSVLDGGLPRWIAEGNNVETGELLGAGQDEKIGDHDQTDENHRLRLDEDFVATYADILENLRHDKGDRAAILDARPADR